MISFKDPREDNTVPTPVWCDDRWADLLSERVKDGMGFMPVHAMLADVPKEHRMVTDFYGA